MKILHVNDNDLIGARFNGYSMLTKQEDYGVEIKQVVLSKASNNPNVIQLCNHWTTYKVCSNFEKRRSIKNIFLPPYDLMLERLQAFQEADVVHYHLIHNNLMPLFSLERLFHQKKSVWTIHDPWILTGHCVYPIKCDKWRQQCSNCPHLERTFSLEEDRSTLNFVSKQIAFKNLDVDLVVASYWMYDLIKNSPFSSYFPRISVIPFGVDTNTFFPRPDQTLRREFKINNDFPTIMFRQDSSEFKGLDFIKRALNSISIPINLVTVGQMGKIDEIKTKVKDKGGVVLENSWLDSPILLSKLYSLSDVFLMPSIAESFGLMAIESLACGTPVIALKGTALERILPNDKLEGFPQAIVSTPSEMANSIREIILKKSCSFCDKLRKFALSNYNERGYISNHIKLYSKILSRS